MLHPTVRRSAARVARLLRSHRFTLALLLFPQMCAVPLGSSTPDPTPADHQATDPGAAIAAVPATASAEVAAGRAGQSSADPSDPPSAQPASFKQIPIPKEKAATARQLAASAKQPTAPAKQIAAPPPMPTATPPPPTTTPLPPTATPPPPPTATPVPPAPTAVPTTPPPPPPSPTPAVVVQSAAVSGSTSQYRAWMEEARAQYPYNASVDMMWAVMLCESGGNPQTVGSGLYYGLFQYRTATWAGAWNPFRAQSILDPRAQIFATAKAWHDGYQHWWSGCL